MRKTKENSARPLKGVGAEAREAAETANEERAAAVGGETSTEGLGNGFDDDEGGADAEEKALSSADGPMAGENTDPPSHRTPKRGQKSRHRKHGITLPDSPSNHAAAHSSKTI